MSRICRSQLMRLLGWDVLRSRGPVPNTTACVIVARASHSSASPPGSSRRPGGFWLLFVFFPELRRQHYCCAETSVLGAPEHFRWLLSSAADDDKFGSLRPDIVIADHQGFCLAIADAKYKTNRINASNRTGVITDDLYQLSAYLSGFGDRLRAWTDFLFIPPTKEAKWLRACHQRTRGRSRRRLSGISGSYPRTAECMPMRTL
jgi:hypothetical protein